VTPFRNRKVKGQGNKVTSNNRCSFEGRPTTDDETVYKYRCKVSKIKLIYITNMYFPAKFKDLK